MLFSDWKEKSKGLEVPTRLLWDVSLTDLDWYDIRKLLVQRVVERGKMEDFYAVIRLYGGIESFREIITEVHHLSDRNMALVCRVFDLEKEELGCYKRKKRREKIFGIVKPTYPL